MDQKTSVSKTNALEAVVALGLGAQAFQPSYVAA